MNWAVSQISKSVLFLLSPKESKLYKTFFSYSRRQLKQYVYLHSRKKEGSKSKKFWYIFLAYQSWFFKKWLFLTRLFQNFRIWEKDHQACYLDPPRRLRQACSLPALISTMLYDTLGRENSLYFIFISSYPIFDRLSMSSKMNLNIPKSNCKRETPLVVSH
jgi:hypothetical protein